MEKFYFIDALKFIVGLTLLNVFAQPDDNP
jgi:hypothetical protein